MELLEKINKSKKKVTTQLSALLLAVTLFMGLGTGCSKKDNTTIPEDCIRGYHEFVKDATPDEFIIIDVGNYEKKLNQKQLKKCNEKDIPVGIIISTQAEDEVSIYFDVEYVRSLINDYDINYPVYLNIENIVNSPSINNEMKEKIIRNFLEKCTSNGIYVGLYGHDEKLSLVEKYFGSDITSNYDSYLIEDKIGTTSFNGKYNVIEALDGTIYSKENLSTLINKQSLNENNNLVNDKKYTIEDTSNLKTLLNELSLDSGLSLEDLLKYNNLKEKDITVGTIIKIPSRVGNSIINVENNTSTSGLIRGCDISSYQQNINWEILSNTCTFVIIKASQGTTIESSFTGQVKNAQDNGIPVGVYCFNNYSAISNSINLENFIDLQNKQVDTMLTSLANLKIDYPVYLDIERINSSEEGIYWSNLMPKEYAINMINIWCDKIEKAGYTSGLYFNEECYNYFISIYKELKSLSSLSDSETKFISNFEKTAKWLAGGEQYSNTRTFDVEEVNEPSKERLEKFNDIEMFQVTSSGINFGAGNHLGHLDINYSLVDYSKLKNENNQDTKVEIQTEEKNILEDISPYLISTSIGVGLGLASGLTISNCKKKVRRR